MEKVQTKRVSSWVVSSYAFRQWKSGPGLETEKTKTNELGQETESLSSQEGT